MSFALLCGALVLGTYAAVSTLLSLVVALAWRRSAREAGGLQPTDAAPRMRALFRLRLVPTIGALVVVFGFVLPAFLLFEPHGTHEPVEGALALLAAAGALLVGSGVARALVAWRATRRLTRDWCRRAQPLELPGAPAPTYVFEHPFPAVSLVGLRRPRLFVARGVLDALEPDELHAVLRHEAGHLAADDNLRALLVRACPDLLAWLPLGSHVRRAWTRAVEAAADDHATGRDPARALDLASALIKLGRLAPAGMRLALPNGAGASAAADDVDGLAERVERLLARAALRGQPAPPAPSGVGLPVRVRTLGASTMAVLSTAAVVALVAHADVLRAVHHALEHAVHFLR